MLGSRSTVMRCLTRPHDTTACGARLALAATTQGTPSPTKLFNLLNPSRRAGIAALKTRSHPPCLRDPSAVPAAGPDRARARPYVRAWRPARGNASRQAQRQRPTSGLQSARGP